MLLILFVFSCVKVALARIEKLVALEGYGIMLIA